MIHMTTRLATKLCLTVAVSFLSMTTLVAPLRSVTWINQDNRNTSKFRLVSNETAELVERPTQSFRSLLLPNRCSGVDTAQVFQSDSTTSAFGFRNEILAHTMISVSPEPTFLA